MSQGCAVSIAYAVRHPERVSHLVLYGGFARGRRKRGSAQEMEQADALITLMRHGWGRENPAFRQIFTSLFIPGGTPEQMKWFNDLQRMTTSPENAVRIRQANDDIDVDRSAAAGSACRRWCCIAATTPWCRSRRAGGSPRASPARDFVALEGHNHLVLEGDPGWSRLLDEIRDVSQDLTPAPTAENRLFLHFVGEFCRDDFAQRSPTSGTMAQCSTASISNPCSSRPSSPR